jgi:hypothetical protein
MILPDLFRGYPAEMEQLRAVVRGRPFYVLEIEDGRRGFYMERELAEAAVFGMSPQAYAITKVGG